MTIEKGASAALSSFSGFTQKTLDEDDHTTQDQPRSIDTGADKREDERGYRQ